VNGIHISSVLIGGLLLGVIYDIDEESDTQVVILCLLFFGIKIEWW
jgi:hypothetical protein